MKQKICMSHIIIAPSRRNLTDFPAENLRKCQSKFDSPPLIIEPEATLQQKRQKKCSHLLSNGFSGEFVKLVGKMLNFNVGFYF